MLRVSIAWESKAGKLVWDKMEFFTLRPSRNITYEFGGRYKNTYSPWGYEKRHSSERERCSKYT